MKENKIDIVMLQETHLVESDRFYLEKIWNGAIHMSGESTQSKGLLTLFSKSIATGNIKKIFSDDRKIISSITSDQKNFLIVNIYGPYNNDEKIKHINNLLHKLKTTITNITDHHLICAGDFNIVRNNDFDIISGFPHSEEIVSKFNSFINEIMLNDTWRLMHYNEKMHSWRRGNIARRLDCIFIDDSLIPYLQTSEISSIGFSDHLPVTILIKFTTFKRGCSCYKMNTKVLTDINYVALLKENIPKIINNNARLNPHLKWEMVKIEIKELTQQYCRNIAHNRKLEKTKLKTELDKLKKNLAKNPTDQVTLQRQAEAKSKYEDFIIDETKGIMIRSGIKWIDEGEKTQFFFCH